MLTNTTSHLSNVKNDSEIAESVLNVISLFRAGLPKREDWLNQILLIPAEAWSHELRQTGPQVSECIFFRYKFDSYYINAEFEERSTIEKDLTCAVEHNGRVIYDRCKKSDDKSNPPSLNLDNFPEALSTIISTVRGRLIEDRKYEITKSNLIETARQWRKTEQWAFSVLDSALSNQSFKKKQIEDNKADLLANTALRLHRPVSSEGDSYELEEILKSSEIETQFARLEIINFLAPMYDIYRNDYPTTHLFIRVHHQQEKQQVIVPHFDFLFDAGFGEEYWRYIKLLEGTE